MWWLLCQALSLQLKQPDPWEDLDVYAHVAAAQGLSAGLEESARRHAAETAHLQDLITSLHTELEAAELARSQPNVTDVVPVPPPVQGADAAALARDLAESRVRTELRIALNESVDTTLETIRAMARTAGEHVASAAASAAATHASEVAASHLVEVACELFAGPSAEALYEGARNASSASGATHADAHEAGELAAASADKVLKACIADAEQQVESARAAALRSALADAQGSAALAADQAVDEVAPPAARTAAREYLAALLPRAVRDVREEAADAVRAAFAARMPTAAEYATSDEQVQDQADELIAVGEAAEKVVEGAEQVALRAALKEAAPDLPDRLAAAVLARRPRVSEAIAVVTAQSTA